MTHPRRLRSGHPVPPRRLWRRLAPIALVAAATLAPAGSARAATVAAGTQHSCAVLISGGVSCWGASGSGQLGNGGEQGVVTPTPVAGITDAISVGAGMEHTCALHVGGRVSCWGYNALGQLGNGTTNSSSTPVAVSGLTDATSIAVGYNQSCAVRATGTVVCWGDDTGVGTGPGIGPKSTTPYEIPGITGATGVLIARGATCVSAGTGTRCWTHDIDMGDGGKTKSPTALPIPMTADVVSVSSSPWGHDCVARATGSVSCRGYNGQGELGLGVADSIRRPEFGDVQGVTDAATVASTAFGACALGRAGGVQCWGSNMYGELGNGTPPAMGSRSTVPVPVTGITDARQITAAGGSHACIADAAGAVKCWGSYVAVPTVVPGVTVPTLIAGNYPDSALPGGGSTSELGTRFGLSVGKVARRAASTSTKAHLGNGFVALSRFKVPSARRGTCPAKVTVTVAGTKAAGRTKGSYAVTVGGPRACTLSAVVELRGKLAKAKSVTMTITAKGIQPKTKRLKAS